MIVLLPIVIDFEHMIDTMKIARSMKRFKSCGLSELRKEFGIEIVNAHRATDDCLLTLEVYKKLKGL